MCFLPADCPRKETFGCLCSKEPEQITSRKGVVGEDRLMPSDQCSLAVWRQLAIKIAKGGVDRWMQPDHAHSFSHQQPEPLQEHCALSTEPGVSREHCCSWPKNQKKTVNDLRHVMLGVFLVGLFLYHTSNENYVHHKNFNNSPLPNFFLCPFSLAS